MSSRKAAAAKRAPRFGREAEGKPAVAKPVAVKAASKPRVVASNSGVSADAIRLAADIEREFAKNDDALSPEAMQSLMSALCRVYAAQVENGAKYTPIRKGKW